MYAYSKDTCNNILEILHQGLSTRQIVEGYRVGQAIAQRVRTKHAAMLPRPMAHDLSKLHTRTVRLLTRWMRLKEPPTIAEATRSLDTDFDV
jgi:hypothetical protein